jgi:type II secretory pathway pseudopilin PulG
VPVELGIALVLLGGILAAIFPLISERVRRRRIERDIALFFERRHRRTYCTRL